MLIHGDTVYVTRHSRISSGCAVTALDVGIGKRHWRTELKALGPIGHSKYSNLVRLEVIGDQLVVFGLELFGHHVESLDLKTGKRRSNRIVSKDLPTPSFHWEGRHPMVHRPLRSSKFSRVTRSMEWRVRWRGIWFSLEGRGSRTERPGCASTAGRGALLCDRVIHRERCDLTGG